MQMYRVKILDFKYQPDFEHLAFQYLIYEVHCQSKEEAVKKARDLYMRGGKETSSKKIPLLLKLFSVLPN